MSKESSNPYGFIPADPSKEQIGYYPVATTQTLAKGDPVILSGGQVAVAVAASSTELLGVIAQDSESATAGTLVAVYDDPSTEFFARTNADASSVAIGYHADLAGTTGAFTLNVSASSQDLFCILGTKVGDTNSTVGAHLRCKIMKHALADISS